MTLQIQLSLGTFYGLKKPSKVKMLIKRVKCKHLVRATLIYTHNVEGMEKNPAMLKTFINDAICDLGNIIKQRTMILGPVMKRQDRDRDRGRRVVQCSMLLTRKHSNAED